MKAPDADQIGSFDGAGRSSPIRSPTVAGRREPLDERFFSEVIESLTHPFYVIDAETYQVLLSNSAAQLDQHAAVTTCYNLTHGRNAPCSVCGESCPVETVRKTGKPFVVEHVHRGSQGGPRTVEVHAYPAVDERGHVTRIIVYALDVTERRRLEVSLSRAQKMESVGRLAGGVAHDFNNMLTAILGYAEHILTRLPTDHAVRQDVTVIKQAAERATDLTRRLLDFSRDSAPDAILTDVNAVVQRVGQLLAHSIGEDIVLKMDTAPSLSSVLASPSGLEQALMNLAVNARDAMPKGGTLHIATAEVSLDGAHALGARIPTDSPQIVLTVSDTGTGLSAEAQAHLFEPFFTTKRAKAGTGLGLSTVYSIVRQHRGQISVDTESERGTTFRIFLPVAGPPQKPEVAVGPSAAIGGSETVLLCEDEPQIRELLVEMLSSLGYQVLSAANADEARQKADGHQGPLDLLLTDVVMPGTNGVTLAESLLGKRPQMRVLLTSGYARDIVAEEHLSRPGWGFVGKPMAMSTLAVAVRKLLDGGCAPA